MAVAPEDLDHLIRFGDTCCLYGTSVHGFVSASLTSTIGAPVVVQPKAKDGVHQGNFEQCLFQILDQDKYAAIAKMGKKIRILQKKTRDADRREQEDLHHAKMVKKRELMRKVNAGFVSGASPEKRTKGVGFSGEVDDDELEPMKRTIEPEMDVAKAIDQLKQRYKDQALAEARDNELEQRRRFATPVHYGDIIQLWNAASRKFLRVSATSNALNEPSSMKVEMTASVDNCCHFKVMPRYKIRSEGDEIRDDDEVVFESVHASGQYLHTASRIELRFHDKTVAERSQCPIPHAYEVTASVNKGSYKLQHYSRPLEYRSRDHSTPLEMFLYDFAKVTEDFSSEVNLNAGDVVQLFHKDSDSYISAEGSRRNPYSTDPIHKPTMDVHMRNRRPDLERPNRLEAPTSATTFFRVEHRKFNEGGPIGWGTAVRLKHVPSGLYLCMGKDTDYDDVQTELVRSGTLVSPKKPSAFTGFGDESNKPQPTLVELSADVLESTLFELHNESLVGPGADRFVDNDAYVRIQHRLSRTWLHPSKYERPRRPLRVCDNSGLPTNSTSSETESITGQLDESFDESSGAEDLDIDFEMQRPVKVKTGKSSFVESMEVLTWDHAPLYELEMTEIHKFDDAFSIRMVDPDLVHYCDYIAGFKPFLHRYAYIRERRELTTFEAEEIARQLNELDDFMYVKRLPQKRRTKQMRTLGIIDALVRMLQAPFRKTRDSNARIPSYDDVIHHDLTEMVMINVFRLLQTFLKGECRKNELFMCQYGDFLWGLFGTEMRVEPMFNELVRDNMKVVQEVTEEEIKRVIRLMEQPTGRNPYYLEFLSVLCVCDGDPYRRHQKSIGELLLNQEGKVPPVFLTDVVQPTPSSPRRVMVSVTGKDSDRMFLEEFALSALDEVDKTSSEEYLFLQRQLELFGNLCQGRMTSNIVIITELRGYLTWEECFLCATSRSETHETAYQRRKRQPIKSREVPIPGMGTDFLPRSLRKIYVDLLTNLFVNVGENRDVLSKVDLNYNWDEVTRSYYDEFSSDPTKALSGATFEHFPQVRNWIMWELSQVESMTHVDRYMGQPFNKLLRSLLNLLHYLIKYGYYASGSDIAGLMRPLEGVLSGMNDTKEVENMYKSDSLKSSKSEVSVFGDDPNDPKVQRKEYLRWLHKGRYVLDDDGLAVMEAKYVALQCVNSLFNHVFNVRLRFLLADFKQGIDPRSVTNSPKNMRRRSAYNRNVFDAVIEAKTKEGLYKETKQMRDYLDSLSESCNWILAECDPGWNITKHHVSTTANPTLVEVLLDLAKYEGHYPLLTLSMQLITRLYTTQEDLYNKAVQALILMTESSKTLGQELKFLVPLLNREGAGVISGDSIKTFISVLRYLTARCYKVSHRNTEGINSIVLDSHDPGEQHTMNQEIIYNTGVLSIVMDVVKTDGQEPCVLSACFEFMRALATCHANVQKKLMESLDIILQAEVAVVPDKRAQALSEQSGWKLRSWQDSMGLAISEIFVSCKETCIGIRPTQVESILDLLAVHSTSAPTFLDALEAIAKVEEYDLPLKRNQLLTIKNLMLHKVTLIDVAYIDDNSDKVINAQRLNLLRKGVDKFGEPNETLRHYHLSLVNLLASTCEGENRQIEATCRSIFSLDELIETICDPDIQPLKKTAYLKFLLWVYLNAEGSVAEIGTDQIERDPNISLVRGLTKIGTDFLGKCYMRSQKGANGTSESSSTQAHASFVFDAFIPVLYNVATKHLPRTPKEYRIAMDLVKQLIPHVVHCVESTLASSRGDEHLNNFRALGVAHLLLYFVKSLEVVADQNVVGAVKRLSGVISDRIDNYDAGIDPRRSSVRKQFTMDAGEEIEADHNTRFNNFAMKLGTAYGGRNTVRDQLSPVSNRQPGYRKLGQSELSSSYCEGTGHDEALPLGPEFQYFSKIFTKATTGSFLQAIQLDVLKTQQDNHGDRTEIDTDAMAVLVRLWRGALSFQAQADSLEREANEIVVHKTLLAIRALLHNEETVVEQTSHLQGAIVNTKAVLPISMLLGSANGKLKREVLALSKALLRNGYSETQKAFARHFLSTREETFFIDVSALIIQAETAIKERRELLKQKAVAEAARSNVRETMRTTLGRKQAKKVAGQLVDGATVMEKGDDDTTDIDHSDNSRLVFCVLQFMCEGHNSILQNYLRTQPDNLKSFNLVEMTSKFLLTITDELVNTSSAANSEDSSFAESLIEQCLDTLVEFSQGSVDNQECIFNARATDAVNTLIRQPLGIFKDIRDEYEKNPQQSELTMDIMEKKLREYTARADLDYVCAQLINSQLESNDDRTAKLARELDKALDIGCVLIKMSQYMILDKMTGRDFTFVEAEAVDDPDDGSNSPFNIAFAFYNIVARLSDFTGKKYHKMPSHVRQDRQWREDLAHVRHSAFGNYRKKATLDDDYNKIKKNTGVIEVIMDDELQKVHFYIDPEWRKQLRKDVKETLLWEVDRSSTTDSVRDFAERCKTVIADMKYLKEVQDFSVVTGWILGAKRHFNKAVIVLSYIINLLMLIVWKAPDEEYRKPSPDYIYDFWDKENIFLILWLLHVVATLFATLAYFLAFPPSVIALYDDFYGLLMGAEALEEKHRRRAMKHKGTAISTPEEAVQDTFTDEDVEIDDAKAAEAEAQDEVFQSQRTVSIINDTRLIDRSSYRTHTSPLSPLSFYHIVFLGMSLAGYSSHGYTLSFHLLHIIIGNQTLSRVIQSVTKNGSTLLYVALLIMVMIYIFSLVVFAYMRKDLDPLEGAFCENLAQCFVTSIRYGLLSGGGLGEAVPQENYGFDEPLNRFFFDIVFFVLITTIGLNVVFGIIVDTFSELRDDKYRTVELMNGQCFICGRQSYDFQRYGNGFRSHIRHEHNMWNYLFYFKHLDEMDPTEFNAVEQYVAEKLFTERYDFFPINKALVLSEMEDEVEEINEIQADLKKIMEMLERSQELEKDEERIEQMRAQQLQSVAAAVAQQQSQ